MKVPAAAAVPPIAGGEARYVEKPVPETVDDALSVVNAPAAAVDCPIVTAFNADTVDPRACEVAPNVIVELVRLALPMADKVLLAPEIVLPVSVCESEVPTISPDGDVLDVPHAEPVETAIPAPGYVMAATLIDPPRLTGVPFIVIDELVRLALPIADRVLLAPDMVLPVSVCVSAVVTSVLLAGIDVPFSVVVLDELSVVNAPAAGEVPPIAGGDAR